MGHVWRQYYESYNITLGIKKSEGSSYNCRRRRRRRRRKEEQERRGGGTRGRGGGIVYHNITN